MHFGMKHTLKSNRKHTSKQAFIIESGIHKYFFFFSFSRVSLPRSEEIDRT
jgi:hypothetical protein